jgi:hypothetical protein
MTATLPGIIFPAIYLLFLAYTNRFLALTSISRKLIADYSVSKDKNLLLQLSNFKHRMNLIRYMQMWGVTSLFLATASITVLVTTASYEMLATILFVGAMVCFIASLATCIRELSLSIKGIELEFQRVLGSENI